MWTIQHLFEKFLSMNEILCTIYKDLEGFLWNMRIVLFPVLWYCYTGYFSKHIWSIGRILKIRITLLLFNK